MSATGLKAMLQAGWNERLKSAVQMVRLILTSTFFKTRLLTAVSHSVAKRRFQRLKSWHFFIAVSIGKKRGVPFAAILYKNNTLGKGFFITAQGANFRKIIPRFTEWSLVFASECADCLVCFSI
ncbi:MAG: hypothetical protein J1D88_04230 [Treponema sp.]|nr:hypothetical protein [Treponema sp.]